MSTQPRPGALAGGRRSASGAWSRLKPVSNADPLETYGLPSKGETRLNDFKTQESFYNKIVERYMKFCGSKSGDELEGQFASLGIADKSRTPDPRPNSATSTEPSRGGQSGSKHATATATAPPAPSTAAATPSSTADPPRELIVLLSAMRKLREAIVAAHRLDTFAQRAYIFLIRAAILLHSWESYAPALVYLVVVIHPATPLAPTELNEFVAYRILDAACRLGDLGLAHEIRARYRSEGWEDKTGRVGMVLRSLAVDDWCGFWRARRGVDGYQRRLMEGKVQEMRLHALKCLGMSYFGAEKAFVEKAAGMEWEGLVREVGVGWELGGDWVVIRRMKGKGKGTVGGGGSGGKAEVIQVREQRSL